MVKNLYQLLTEIANERAVEVVNDIAVSNKTYKQLTQEIKKSYDNIRNNLPIEHKKFLDKYEDVIGMRQTLTFETLYKLGLIDGIKICNLCDKLKNNDLKQLKHLLKIYTNHTNCLSD